VKSLLALYPEKLKTHSLQLFPRLMLQLFKTLIERRAFNPVDMILQVIHFKFKEFIRGRTW